MDEQEAQQGTQDGGEQPQPESGSQPVEGHDPGAPVGEGEGQNPQPEQVEQQGPDPAPGDEGAAPSEGEPPAETTPPEEAEGSGEE